MSAGKPRLLLHIGGQKCGSSAIQGYLFFNRAALAGQGVVYIDRDFGADVANAVSHNAMLDKVLDLPVGDFVAAFAALARNAGGRTSVFTSEGLCTMARVGRYASRFGLLRELFDLRAVFYVRNQAELLYGGWQQWGSALEFPAWIDKALGERRADWGTIAAAWAGALGAANIDAVLFRQEDFPGGDVVADFCARSGVPLLAERNDRAANPTLPDLTVLALQRIAALHGVAAQGLIRHLKRTPGYTFPAKQNLVCSASDIARIQAAYHAGNDALWQTLALPAARRADFDRLKLAPQVPLEIAALDAEVARLLGDERLLGEIAALRKKPK